MFRGVASDQAKAGKRGTDRDVSGPATALYHWTYPRHVVRCHANRLTIIIVFVFIIIGIVANEMPDCQTTLFSTTCTQR